MIKEFPNYEVSPEGQVFNIKTGRQMSQQLRGEYKTVKLSRNGEQSRFYVHRLVAGEFCLRGVGATQVNHKDGDKLNNHYQNLEWVTHSENCLHRNRVLGKSNEGRRGKIEQDQC